MESSVKISIPFRQRVYTNKIALDSRHVLLEIQKDDTIGEYFSKLCASPINYYRCNVRHNVNMVRTQNKRKPSHVQKMPGLV